MVGIATALQLVPVDGRHPTSTLEVQSRIGADRFEYVRDRVEGWANSENGG
jgi:hypothetical protein